MRPVPRYRHTQFGAVVVGSLTAFALDLALTLQAACADARHAAA